MNKGWRYEDYPNANEILKQNCDRVLQELLDLSPAVSIEMIKDTRRIHKTVFEQLAHGDQKPFAGHYRGEDFACLKNRRGSRRSQISDGLHATHCFTSPENVCDAMDRLKEGIDALFRNIPLISPERHYQLALATLMRFYLIHPYANGNGHIGRIMITYLMKLAHVPMAESWSVHPSPFTNAIAVCLFTHARHPVIAEQYFRQWFTVSIAQHASPSPCAESDETYTDSDNSGFAYSDDSDSDSSAYGSEDSDSGYSNSRNSAVDNMAPRAPQREIAFSYEDAK